MTKALLVVALCAAAPAAAQQRTILDLNEGYGEGIGQLYTLLYDGPESGVRLTSSKSGHVGRSAEAAWRIRVGPGGLGYAGFGYLHSAATSTIPFPDLTPYTHLSLWYNNVVPAAGAERVAFRFELHEEDPETDARGDTRRQTWVYETRDVLTTPTGWTELRIPLVTVEGVGGDGFAVVPGGFQGDGRLDLDGIGYWTLLLLVEDGPVGTVIAGTTRFDYLTAEVGPVTATPEDETFADALFPGYPNPFAASTTLAYTLRQPAVASLRVYDVLGREAAVLVGPRPHGAGRHEATLSGAGLAAGTYVCVLDVGGARFTRRVTLGR